MKISQLKQPYKKLAQFYTNDDRKKQRGLDLVDAFEWGYCVHSKYTKSHKNFWLSVDLGESPKIPKTILDHFNQHNPKEAFQVMGVPKPVSEKPKVVTAKKAKAEVSYDHLIGKKIKGFAFKDGTDDVFYNDIMMGKFIKKTGTIKRVEDDCAMVKFPGSSIFWVYPLSLVLKQLDAVSDAATDAVKPSTDDNQHLVGRKIRSFKFESGTNGVYYDTEIMDNLLGYHGTIIAAYPDAVQVSFKTRKGTIIKFYPFGKDLKTSILGDSVESRLIPEEEVQKIFDNMPAEPFKVGETVYLRGNGGQYKCVIDRIYFSGNCPISLDAGERTILQDIRIDGKRSPKGDVVLSHTPWCDENGVPLEIHNLEPETIKEEVTIDCDIKPEDIEAGIAALQTLETVHLFADILKGVHDFTGQITPADIDYHVSLIERNLSK